MVHFPRTLWDELRRTTYSKEWKEACAYENAKFVKVTLELQSPLTRNSHIGMGGSAGQGVDGVWARSKVEVFLKLVRLTCIGRTLELDKGDFVFVIPHATIVKLLKSRSYEMAVQAGYDAITLLGDLVADEI